MKFPPNQDLPSSAARNASRGGTIPTGLPSASIKRTSSTLLICSLTRARSLSRLFYTEMLTLQLGLNTTFCSNFPLHHVANFSIVITT